MTKITITRRFPDGSEVVVVVEAGSDAEALVIHGIVDAIGKLVQPKASDLALIVGKRD